jgi:hypothetical protein
MLPSWEMVPPLPVDSDTVHPDDDRVQDPTKQAPDDLLQLEQPVTRQRGRCEWAVGTIAKGLRQREAGSTRTTVATTVTHLSSLHWMHNSSCPASLCSYWMHTVCRKANSRLLTTSDSVVLVARSVQNVNTSRITPALQVVGSSDGGVRKPISTTQAPGSSTCTKSQLQSRHTRLQCCSLPYTRTDSTSGSRSWRMRTAIRVVRRCTSKSSGNASGQYYLKSTGSLM